MMYDPPMHRPEEHRIPEDIWPSMIQYGVTPSMNLVFDDGTGHFLFLERLNEPVKGHLWIPGGRLRNGETREAAVLRIAEQELGVGVDCFEVLHVSDRSNEEIYPIAEMGDQAAALDRYGSKVQTVHYWGGVAYVRATKGRPKVALDAQSGGYEWLKQMPKNPHPYLQWYMEVIRQAGFPVPA